MENLIITESRDHFPEAFLSNPANLVITNSQAPLLLPCFQKQVFGGVTVHNSILLGEKKLGKSSFSNFNSYPNLFYSQG